MPSENSQLLGLYRLSSSGWGTHERAEKDGRVKRGASRRLRLQWFAPANYGLVSPLM